MTTASQDICARAICNSEQFPQNSICWVLFIFNGLFRSLGVYGLKRRISFIAFILVNISKVIKYHLDPIFVFVLHVQTSQTALEMYDVT